MVIVDVVGVNLLVLRGSGTDERENVDLGFYRAYVKVVGKASELDHEVEGVTTLI